MDCQRASELIEAAVLGELEGAEAVAFRRHVRQCPACREDLDEVRAALELGGEQASRCVPAGLDDRVLGAARAELAAARAKRHRRLVLVSSAASAAAVVLFALAMWFMRQDGAVVHDEAKCSCWRFVAGDPGNSRQAETNKLCLPGPILWKQPVGGMPGTHKPLVWKNLVIVGTAGPDQRRRKGRSIVAFEGDTGRIRWRHVFDSGDFYKAKSFPDRCIHNGRLFVTDGRRCLVLDAADGRELARFDPPVGSSGWGFLTACDSRLYGAAGDGRSVFCLDAASGRKIWSRSIDGAVFVPALSRGRLFVHTNKGTLSALDAATGREVWRREPAGPAGRASIHARGRWVLVLGENDEVSAFRADTGQPVWRRRVPGAFSSGLAIGQEAVYTAGGAVTLALADGRLVRQRSGWVSGMCSAPTSVGKQVMATGGRTSGRLSVFGPSGELLGSLDGLGGESCDGAIVSQERIYLVGAGRLLAIACRSGG